MSSGGDNIILSSTQAVNTSSAANVSLMKLGTLTQTLIGIVLTGAVIGATVTTVALISVRVGVSAPIARDDTTVAYKQAITDIYPLTNDRDPRGANLTITEINQPMYGKAWIVNGRYVKYQSYAYYAGPDNFNYTISNDKMTARATVFINVLNQPPQAVDFVFAVSKNSVDNTFDLFSTSQEQRRIVDMDNDIMVISDVSGASHGDVSTNGTHVFYTPDTNSRLGDMFNYTISDRNDTSTATITIQVLNKAPIAIPDNVVAAKNTEITVNVLENDYDVNSDNITIVGVGASKSVQRIQGNSIVYLPLPITDPYTDSFEYTISDGDATATSYVTVRLTNTPPVAFNNTMTVVKNTIDNAVAIGMSDVDVLDTLSAQLNDAATQYGTLRLEKTTRIVNRFLSDNWYNVPVNTYTVFYTPRQGAVESDVIEVVVTDGYDTTTAFVDVTIINTAPVAVDDHFNCSNNLEATFNLLANDYDENGDDIVLESFSEKTTALGGKVVRVNDNQVKYTSPTGVQPGEQDSFTYKINDVQEKAANNLEATATVYVTLVNDAPVAVDDSVTIARSKAATVQVLDNDSDPNGDEITVLSVGTIADATVTISADKKTVQIQSGAQLGSFELDYEIEDTHGATASAIVKVDIVNVAPVPEDDSVETLWNRVAVFNVIDNDTDENGDTLSISSFTNPTNGVLTKMDTVSFKYTPNNGFVGTDSFTYKVYDGYQESGTSATVTITVKNNAPTAVDDLATVHWASSVTVAVLANDTDVDGDSLSLKEVSTPNFGTATTVRMEDGTDGIRYTSDGSTGAATFTYTVTDGNMDSVATVSIDVTNTVPVAVADSLTVHWQSSQVSISVLDNDEDEDNDAISIDRVVQGDDFKGTIEVSSDKNELFFTPTDFVGTQTVTYYVTDGPSNTANAQVTITTTNDNVPQPGAVSRTVHWSTQSVGTPIEIFDVETPVDEDGDALSFTFTQGSNGQVANETSGSIYLRYTQDAQFLGTDTFTYTVSDGVASADTVVTINVVNEKPTANDFNTTKHWNAFLPNGITVDAIEEAQASDADNEDTVSLKSVTANEDLTGKGTITFHGSSITFKPTTGFVGTVTFDVVFTDGIEDVSCTYEVTVQNEMPVVTPDTVQVHWRSIASGYAIDLAAAVSDADSDPVTFTIDASSNIDSTVIQGENLIAKQTTPSLGASSVSVTFSDGWQSVTETWNIDVYNTEPTVSDKSLSTHWRTTSDVLFNVLSDASDADTLDTVTLKSIDDADMEGSASIVGNQVKYVPKTNFVGTDSFTFTATDGLAEVTKTATVQVTNTKPVPNDDSVTIAWRTKTVDIPVLDNDVDANSDPIQIDSVTNPTTGTVSQDGTKITYTIASSSAPTSASLGTFTFNYEINDVVEKSVSPATVTVTVTNNNKPSASSFSRRIHWRSFADQSFAITSTKNDGDGDSYSVNIDSNPVSFVVTSDNSASGITYLVNKPASGTWSKGSGSIGYTLSDGIESSSGTIALDVYNSIPTAADYNLKLHWSLLEEGATFNVLSKATDADPQDRNLLTIQSVDATGLPDGAIAEIRTDGTKQTVFYKPAPEVRGTDTFTYTISDGLDTATATISVIVDSLTVTPEDQFYSFHWTETPQSLPLIDNLNSTATTFILDDAGTPNEGGSSTLSGDKKSVTYEQTTGFLGEEIFVAKYKDGEGATETTDITVTVSITNTPPTAQSQSHTLHRREVMNGKAFDVLALAADADSDSISVTGATKLDDATGDISRTDGVVTYTPATADFVGTGEGFTYVVSDGVQSATGTINIDVYNNPPTTYPKTISAHWKTMIGAGNFEINVLTGAYTGGSPAANTDSDQDSAKGDVVQVTALDTAALGTRAEATDAGNGQVDFELKSPYTVNTAMTFKYTVSDGASNGEVTQLVTVTATNTAPTASPDTASVHWRSSDNVLDVLANDSDDDNDSLTITGATSSAGATVSYTASQVTYTPKTRYTGVDTVTYTITDGATAVTGTATVTVTNTKPTASPVTLTKKWSEIPQAGLTIAIVGSVASDANSDPLTLTVAGVQSGMTVTVNSGSITFKPSQGFVGTTTFTYTVSDSIESASATVSITVTNTAPTATTNTYTRHWRTTTGTIDLTSRFTDLDGDAITFSSVSQGTSGGATSFSGKVVTYTQTTNFVGSERFTVTYSDGWNAPKTQDFTVQVTNAAPVVKPISISQHPATINIPIKTGANAATDSDTADQTFLTVVNSFSGTYPSGTEITTDGSSITVKPVANSLATITIRYSVTDGIATSSETITITLTNNVPTVGTFSDTIHWREASAGKTYNLLQGAIDGDSDTLTVQSVSPSTGVTRTGNSAKFVPSATTGTYSWTFVVSDGYSTTSGTVTITVTNTAPTAVNVERNPRWTAPVVTISAAGVVSDSDSLDAASVAFSDVSSPYATLSSDSKTITFQKTVTASDIDSPYTVTFRAFDGLAKSDVKTITITYKNEAPVTTAHTSTIKWNANADIILNNYCSDASDSIQITRINGVAISSLSTLNSDSSAQASIKGSLTLTNPSTATVRYVPTTNMAYSQSTLAKSAVSTWTFTCSDGLTTTDGTVTVTVTNTQPTATNGETTFARVAGQTQYTITNFIASGLTDVDGDSLSLTNVQGATVSGRDVTVTVDGTATQKSFTFTLFDGQLTSAPATHVVKIGNVAPVCNDGSATIFKGQTSSFNVATLCTDANGDSISVNAVTQPSYGSVSVSGSTFTYTAPQDRSGVFTFTYTAKDTLNAASTSKTITITVQNRAPTSVDSTWTLFARRDSNVHTLSLATYLSNSQAADLDSYDNTRITLSAVQGDTCANQGTIAISGSDIRFTRQYTFSTGTCTFRVTIKDADSNSANVRTTTSTVTINMSTSGLNAVGKTLTVRDAEGVMSLTQSDITSADSDPLGGSFTFDGFLFTRCGQPGFCRDGTTPVQSGNQWQLTTKSVQCQIDRYEYRIRSVQDPSITAVAVLNVEYTNCVCNVPLDMVIVFDGSGSVTAPNFSKMKEFAVSLLQNFQFAENDPTKNARVGIVRFSNANDVVQIQAMTNNKQTAINAVQNMAYTEGATFILDALKLGENMLTTQGRSAVKSKVMLVLFDGEPTGPCSCGDCRTAYSTESTNAAKENKCKSVRFPYRTCNTCDPWYSYQFKCNPCADVVPFCTDVNNRKPDANGNAPNGYWRIIPVGIGKALENAEAQQLLRDMSYDSNRSFYVEWDQLTNLYQTVSDQTCNLIDIGGTQKTVTVVEPNEPEAFKCGDIVAIRGLVKYLTYDSDNVATSSLSTDPNTAGTSRSGLWQIVCRGKSVGDVVRYDDTVSFYNLQNARYLRRVNTRSYTDVFTYVTGTQTEFNANEAQLNWKLTSVGYSTSGKFYHYNSVCIGSTTRTSGNYIYGDGQTYAFYSIENNGNFLNMYLTAIPWSNVLNKNTSPAITGNDLPMKLAN